MLREKTEDKPYFQDFEDDSSAPGVMSGAVSSVGTPLASSKPYLARRVPTRIVTDSFYRSLISIQLPKKVL